MRVLLSTTALALVLAAASPASAQMCGGGQAGTTAAAGGMCGGGMTGQAPAASPSAPAPQQSSGMCSCCRNMAMMRGGQGGMNMPGHSMPGMEMPKAQ